MELFGLLILAAFGIAFYYVFIHAYVEDERKRRRYEASGLKEFPEDGHDFEHWVATKLRTFGWDASVTKSGGDQGIDVIAEKNGLQIGIQCKRFSNRCGNKAVQEAVAGARYYGLQNVAVLATSGFTQSAINLAESCDCVLLSHFDIPELESHFDVIPSETVFPKQEPEKIKVKLQTEPEKILGRCFVMIAKKMIPDMKSNFQGGLRQAVSDLEKNILENIDEHSGLGELSVTKLQLKLLLDYADILLVSKMFLVPETSESETSTKVLDENHKGFNTKLMLDTQFGAKLKSDEKIYFYLMFPEEDVRQLERLLYKLYLQNEIPSANNPNGFLSTYQ